jgi:hypothetical protein
MNLQWEMPACELLFTPDEIDLPDFASAPGKPKLTTLASMTATQTN